MRQEIMWFWDAVASADNMQTICTLLQTGNHTPTPHHSIFTGRMLFALPDAPTNSVKALTAIMTDNNKSNNITTKLMQ